MDILTKMLALLFSLITALGVMPKTIPVRVTLPEIEESDAMISTDCFSFSYDKGSFSLAFDGNTIFADAVSEYKLGDRIVSSLDYGSCTTETQTISDIRGEGKSLTAVLEDENLPTIKQNFTFYNETNYFLISNELIGNAALEYIAENTTLEIDFDNADTVKALPFSAKLFVQKYEEVVSTSSVVASESIEGLSLSFKQGDKADMLNDLLNTYLSKYIKGRITFIPATRRWN